MGQCPSCGEEDVEPDVCPRCGVDARDLESIGEAERACPRLPPRMAAIPGQRADAIVAGFWIRVLAVLIDYGFFLLLGLAVEVVATLLWDEWAASSRVFRVSRFVFNVLFGFWYYIMFHWLWGQTIGKMVVGIRVVTVDAAPISLPVSILRWLGYFVSALPLLIGYVMAGVRGDKRALHDLIAGTRVVRL